MATNPKSSKKPIHTSSCCIAPCLTAASWSAVILASPKVVVTPGNVATSCTIIPVAASMHTRRLELRLAKPPHVDEVADAERVEADVTSPGAVEGLRGGALEVLPADVRSGDRGTLLDTVLVELHLGRAGRSHTLGGAREDRGGGECRRRSGGGGERDRPEHFCYPM